MHVYRVLALLVLAADDVVDQVADAVDELLESRAYVVDSFNTGLNYRLSRRPVQHDVSQSVS